MSTPEERIAFHAERAANAAEVLLALFEAPCPQAPPPRPIASRALLELICLLSRDALALKSALEPRKPRPRLEIVR
jgi:hypothetical protein